MKEAKEIKKATHQKETEKIEKDFDDARKELFEESEKAKSKPKKVKKKIIKYVSSSDSNSSDSEEEVIIKKKKKNQKKTVVRSSNQELVEKSSTDILRDKLVNDQIDSLRELLKPC